LFLVLGEDLLIRLSPHNLYIQVRLNGDRHHLAQTVPTIWHAKSRRSVFWLFSNHIMPYLGWEPLLYFHGC